MKRERDFLKEIEELKYINESIWAKQDEQLIEIEEKDQEITLLNDKVSEVTAKNQNMLKIIKERDSFIIQLQNDLEKKKFKAGINHNARLKQSFDQMC